MSILIFQTPKERHWIILLLLIIIISILYILPRTTLHYSIIPSSRYYNEHIEAHVEHEYKKI